MDRAVIHMKKNNGSSLGQWARAIPMSDLIILRVTFLFSLSSIDKSDNSNYSKIFMHFGQSESAECFDHIGFIKR